ncbi:hypothetical protein GCM10028805_54290 [Spirosoma harenae]
MNQTIPLTKELQARLLSAMRTDQLNLAAFPELLPDETAPTPRSSYPFTEPENEQLNDLLARARYQPMLINLDRSIKIRLLKAIGAAVISPAEFPEFIQACQKRQIDLAIYSPQELDFLTELALQLD